MKMNLKVLSVLHLCLLKLYKDPVVRIQDSQKKQVLVEVKESLYEEFDIDDCIKTSNTNTDGNEAPSFQVYLILLILQEDSILRFESQNCVTCNTRNAEMQTNR